jgi:thioredoxin-related protein
MKTHRLVLVVFITFLFSAATGAEKSWLTDLTEAKKVAAAEEKDILIDFTGSDWCKWCVQLKEEVFDQTAFKTDGLKRFVTVELDFPQKKEISEELKKRNHALMNMYAVRGFPTVILADAQGRPYARTGYQQGGAEAYLKHLTGLQEKKSARDAVFAEAAKATGDEKARLLDKALTPIYQDNLLIGYDEIVAEIRKNDPQNQLGLNVKYFIAQIQSEMRAGGSPAGVPEKIDAYRKTLTNPDKGTIQQLMLLKAGAVQVGGDAETAGKLLQEMIEVDPNSQHALQTRQMLLAKKADAQARQGDFAGAVKILEEAAALLPESQLAKQVPGIVERLKKAQEQREAGVQ